jgi:ferredoxin
VCRGGTGYTAQSGSPQPTEREQHAWDYIIGEECIDCGACESLFPLEAISHNGSQPETIPVLQPSMPDFSNGLSPDATTRSATPGGTAGVGRIGVDTELVAAYDAAS